MNQKFGGILQMELGVKQLWNATYSDNPIMIG